MLITSPRLTSDDIKTWDSYTVQDIAHATTARYRFREEQARSALEAFLRMSKDCYVGVSWGKDSVVVAHMAAMLDLPLVWVRVRPIANPDCVLVRDAFMGMAPFGTKYEEIEVRCKRDEQARDWHASGTLEDGFKIAAEKYGDRHVSGIRGEESATRKLRSMRWGTTTKRTCAPLAFWTGADIFAYLARYDLPVHPAYAMNHRGLAPRDRIRVASLGGKRGTGMGRTDWEETYYGNALRALEQGQTVEEAERLIGEWV